LHVLPLLHNLLLMLRWHLMLMLRRMLKVWRVASHLVLLRTIWLKSLLIPVRYVTLILVPLSEPAVPASISVAAKAS